MIYGYMNMSNNGQVNELTAINMNTVHRLFLVLLETKLFKIK